jgi:hypothetical protein
MADNALAVTDDNRDKAFELVELLKAWGLSRDDVRQIAQEIRMCADTHSTWVDPFKDTGAGAEAWPTPPKRM